MHPDILVADGHFARSVVAVAGEGLLLGGCGATGGPERNTAVRGRAYDWGQRVPVGASCARSDKATASCLSSGVGVT